MEPSRNHLSCLIDSTGALPYCQEHEVYISDKTKITMRDKYEAYVQRVEADNLARDMYDGDTYMGYEDVLSYEEWLKDNEEDI